MKILLLTSVYQDSELKNRDRSTNVINSFVKEWVAQGHDVLVIHNSHYYPQIVYSIPTNIKEEISSRLGFPIPDYDIVCPKYYIDNGAHIFRLPIKKYLPHRKPSTKIIKKQKRKIISILKDYSFNPDVILGHWASPQMELVSELKKIYQCRTAVVLHGSGYISTSSFGAKKYLANIDRLGCRSHTQAKEVKKILELKEEPFVCYSGIPDEYLNSYSLNTDKFNNIHKWIFTYVGRLVEYKNIDAIIKALSVFKDIKWELNIVGEGAQMSFLKETAQKCECNNKVRFWGKIPRQQVMDILSSSHCFIMISTNEIFGLVYLEAMAASCLTIASRAGGVDGIIRDKSNGFLCEEGNSDELKKIIKDILEMDTNTITNIARQGRFTAEQYTDSIVAQKYIQCVTQ